MSMIRTRWAAIGAAVAISLGAGGIGLVDASKGSGERAVYTAIETCRLVDTRPTQAIGGRTTPLSAAEVMTIDVRGANGECTGIPADAVAAGLNITAIGATELTHLTVWPDGAVPNGSSLNPAPGQPPTPNAVTTDLAADGSFRIRNQAGAVHIIIDLVGIYQDHHHDDRYYSKDQIDALNRPVGIVTTVAGDGTFGFADGAGLSTRFNTPTDVAVGPDGTVYVADSGNDRIRAISPAGAVTTLAGSGTPGFADDTGLAAQFNDPTGVAVAADGTVYVADMRNHRIRAISPAGVVTTLAGSGTPGFANGTGAVAQFSYPHGVAVSGDGTVYVADLQNHRIRAVSPAGVVTTLAGSGTPGFADANGTGAQFSNPRDVAVATDGTVYVADTGNNRIRRITPTGAVTTLAGNGVADFIDGTGIAARLNEPYGVAVGSDGTVYVADAYNQRIRRISPDGVTTLLAGSGIYQVDVDGAGRAAGFYYPSGVAVAPDGSLRVADTANDRIRRID